MQILTVDIGTGTQDILLFDSERAVENCLKLVMPSPTLLIGEQIKRATAARLPLAIRGVVMGGGPAAWAVEAHRRAGLRVLATPAAAATFNDDLDYVQRELGVEIIPDEAARKLPSDGQYAHIEFRDFDYEAIRGAFAAFGFDLRPDALALAVFDHGAAPPDVSDRQFRMDYLVERLGRDRRLSTFACRAADVPPIMTRLAALAATALAQAAVPVIVMDTAPAAVLGALDDPVVAAHRSALVANVGNFHTLAFQFREGAFVRLFEHHTGLLTPATLTGWLRALAAGEISHAAVFADHGHGALALDAAAVPLEFLAVVGPRQAMLRDAGLPAYFAVPHGDQMLTGCFGLLRACADLEPAWREPITEALAGRADRSLW
ncbi:MAG: DUF1786 domain-containing protein [Anaerolineae bacterium]|jgi:uncharacterized protein (DUF1786 family)|nr:DUF1786 domain-containing protein [Anaerolineae bacterium]